MIAVTGGSGFFGIAFVEALLKRGAHVRVLDREEIDESFRGRVDFRKVDIRDRDLVIRGLQGSDVVYHNAAVVPISKAKADFWAINEKGTRHVLEGAEKGGAKRVIFYSTSQSLFGISPKLPVTEDTPQNPFGDYGLSKHAAEKICEEYRARGMNLSIIRPRTIIGAGRLGIFQILFEWIRKGSPVYMIGDGTNRLQFVGLQDLIDISLRLLDTGDNEDFNVGTDRFGTLREDLEGLIHHAGTRSRLVFCPGWVAKPGLALLDKLGMSPFVDLHYRTIDHSFYFDISKAKRVFGWSPKQSNLEALIEAYDWYVARADEILKSTGTTHRKAVKKGILSFLR